MSVLGLIPARAGSKKISNKNLAQVAGLSLIEHTIHHALCIQILVLEEML